MSALLQKTALNRGPGFNPVVTPSTGRWSEGRIGVSRCPPAGLYGPAASERFMPARNLQFRAARPPAILTDAGHRQRAGIVTGSFSRFRHLFAWHRPG
jgi:hypothetical protein